MIFVKVKLLMLRTSELTLAGWQDILRLQSLVSEAKENTDKGMESIFFLSRPFRRMSLESEKDFFHLEPCGKRRRK